MYINILAVGTSTVSEKIGSTTLLRIVHVILRSLEFLANLAASIT